MLIKTHWRKERNAGQIWAISYETVQESVNSAWFWSNSRKFFRHAHVPTARKDRIDPGKYSSFSVLIQTQLPMDIKCVKQRPWKFHPGRCNATRGTGSYGANSQPRFKSPWKITGEEQLLIDGVKPVSHPRITCFDTWDTGKIVMEKLCGGLGYWAVYCFRINSLNSSSTASRFSRNPWYFCSLYRSRAYWIST